MRNLSVLCDSLTHTEGARWYAGRFWFSDLYTFKVYSVAEDGSDFRAELDVPGCPSGIGWLPDGRLIVVSKYDRRLIRREHDGAVVTHADLAPYVEAEPNDMVVDAYGRAWVGNMGFDIMTAAPVSQGRLVRVDPDGTTAVVSEPLHFPNGATVINDKTLVVAESLGNRMSAFDIHADGQLSERRDWAWFGPLPDSEDLTDTLKKVVVGSDGISDVDEEGAIWVADFTRPRAVRVLPGGEIIDEVPTGQLSCYSCSLGGATGRTLFMCVAPADFDPVRRQAEPLSQIVSVQVDVPVARRNCQRAGISVDTPQPLHS